MKMCPKFVYLCTIVFVRSDSKHLVQCSIQNPIWNYLKVHTSTNKNAGKCRYCSYWYKINLVRCSCRYSQTFSLPTILTNIHSTRSFYSWLYPWNNRNVSFSETTKTPRREAGRSKGGPHQRVGHQQAQRTRTTEPTAERTKWPLQSATWTAEEPHSGSGDQELHCMYFSDNLMN